MPSNTGKYRVPSGVKIRPSQIGYYNYWYPHEKEEYLTGGSFICEVLWWRGSDKWQAIKVSSEDAKSYRSPIQVVWIESSLFKKMRLSPIIRDRLKERVENK